MGPSAATVDSERTRPMLVIAAVALIWTPATVWACKWIADA